MNSSFNRDKVQGQLMSNNSLAPVRVSVARRQSRRNVASGNDNTTDASTTSATPRGLMAHSLASLALNSTKKYPTVELNGSRHDDDDDIKEETEADDDFYQPSTSHHTHLNTPIDSSSTFDTGNKNSFKKRSISTLTTGQLSTNSVLTQY